MKNSSFLKISKRKIFSNNTGLPGKKLLLIFLIIVSIFTVSRDSKAGWEGVPTTGSTSVWSIEFINKTTGWIGFETGQLLKTTNAGINWVNQNTFTSGAVRRIRMIDSLNGYLSKGDGVYLKTSNGGLSWTGIFPSLQNYGGLDLYQNTVLYGGIAGNYLRSTNGGNNWSTGIISGSAFDIYGVELTDANTVYVTGSPHGSPNVPRIYKSTNAGANFSLIYTPGVDMSGQSLFDIYFTDANNGYACSGNGKILKTTDAGVSWTLTSTSISNLRQIEFIGTDTGFVCGSGGKLMRTNNAGGIWTEWQTPYGVSLNSISYAGGYIWTGGSSTILMRSSYPAVPKVYVSGAVYGNGYYESLTDAFSSISSSPFQTGANIEIRIDSSTTEPPSGGILENRDWASLKVFPRPGSNIIVYGIVPFSPLIELRGAKNVIIDGAPTPGSTLRFINNSSGYANGSATILLRSDASNNIIRNCTFNGYYQSNFSSVMCGVIVIGGSSGITGCDNNLIENCLILNNPGFTNNCGIVMLSSNPSNNNNTVSNCNITGINGSVMSSAIYIADGNAQVNITDNKIFQSSGVIMTPNPHYGIYTINSGPDISITNNTIGYSSESGTGFYTMLGSDFSYTGIYVSNSSATETVIRDNKIQAITLNGGFSGTVFTGINVASGPADVSGNYIGSMTSTNSINIINSSTGFSLSIYGIKSNTSGILKTNGNYIGGLTFDNPTTSSIFNFHGIAFENTSPQSWTCMNNVIGGNVSNSIQNLENHTSALFSGINLLGNTLSMISGNLIQNISLTAGNVFGILINGSLSTVNRNTIQYLSNNGFIGGRVCGINSNSGNICTISQNLIHSLYNSTPTNHLIGIELRSPNNFVYNNMISLGTENNYDNPITGIWDQSLSFTRIYYNSVYIGGSPPAGNSGSQCILNISNGDKFYYNNIFYNARSNAGATGKNAAIFSHYNLISDYNDLFANGNGGLVGISSLTDRVTLSDWQISTGKDMNSLSGDPKFISPTDLRIDTNVVSPVWKMAVPVAEVKVDFDSTMRDMVSPCMGADEFKKFSPPQTGRALRFNGVKDYVRLNTSLSDSVTSPSNNELTIEYWFKGSNIQSAVRMQNITTYIVSGWGNPGNQKHLISNINGVTGIKVGASATDGNWHHVAMTWKRNTVNGFVSYLDGNLIDQISTPDLPLPAVTGNAILGRFDQAPGSEYINGSLDEVRIWKRSLSQAEIMTNMTKQISSGIGLLASYHFDEGIAGENNAGVTTLYDATNNYDGVLNQFSLNGMYSNWIAPGPYPFAPETRTAIVKVLPQGFYNTGLARLNMSDTARLYLCNAVAPFNAIDSSDAVIDSLTFTGSFSFESSVTPGSYYLKVIHRNSLESWSAAPVAMNDSLNYDFTASASQTFGNNSAQASTSPLLFGIYSGDVLRDGTINLNDLAAVYNSAVIFPTGYVITDITGDRLVNLNDLTVVYNNALGFVAVIKP